MAPSPTKIMEAFLVTPVVGLYLFAAGNLSSVYMPRALNAERVAQGGAAGRSQIFMLLVYPVAAVPVLLAYGARYAFHRTAMICSLRCSAVAQRWAGHDGKRSAGRFTGVVLTLAREISETG
jgi:hypothetical protein